MWASLDAASDEGAALGPQIVPDLPLLPTWSGWHRRERAAAEELFAQLWQ